MTRRGSSSAAKITYALFSLSLKILLYLGKPLFNFIYLTLKSFIALQKIDGKLINISFLILLMSLVAGITFFKKGLNEFYLSLPNIDDVERMSIAASTEIVANDLTPLYTFYENTKRDPVPLRSVPLHVRQAFLAAEDKSFYSHPGISINGIGRAVYLYLSKGAITGGSTITQQLVKNLFLSPERSLDRKIKEIYLSLKLESILNKDRIFEMYLNNAPFGGVLYGIAEASKYYFEKLPQELSIDEAAFLASLPKNPNVQIKKESLLLRRNTVLKLMFQNKYIDENELKRSSNKPLSLEMQPQKIKFPHFVMFTRNLLMENLGKKKLYEGGLKVTTTIDPKIQEMAELVVTDELNALKSLRVSNAGVLVVKVKTGEILAMVGSNEYWDENNDGNVNVVLSTRQPGSSIKVVNYAYALSHGFSPASIIDDSPVTFKIKGSKDYSPINYDGAFKGKMTLRNALAQSRNVPAVRVLNSIGIQNMVNLGKEMGIWKSWDNSQRFGLSLTLGGGEVTLLELAQTYNTIANMGKVVPLTPVKNIEGDNLISKNLKICAFISCDQKQVIDERVAFQIIDILIDNEARTPAFGRNSLLNLPQHPEVAVKTGTSNSLRDNLTVGFNQEYLVAVWVGNNDNSPMSRVASGVTGASSIWNRIMRELLKGEPSIAWTTPPRIASVSVCKTTGSVPCGNCPTKNEWFLEENKELRGCLTADLLKNDSNKDNRNERQ